MAIRSGSKSAPGDRHASREARVLFPVVFLILVVATVHSAVAQDRELAGLDQARLTSADLARGQTVLVFWASWSPRGRDIVARVDALEKRYGERARVVMVNFQEDEPTVRRFLSDAAPVPVLLDVDGSFAKRHSVLNLPGVVVYKNGEVVHSGPLPREAAALLDAYVDD